MNYFYLRWSFLLSILLSLSSPATIAAVAGDITFYSNRVDLVTNGSYARWIKEFQSLYPQARVRVEGIPDYEAAMPKRFEARNYGDVMLVPRDMPKQMYAKYFLPLNDLQLQDKIYFPDNWEFNEKQYAYTQGVIAEGLIYNKRALKAAGVSEPPTTLDELIRIATTLKTQGKVAIALNVGAAWPLQQWDKATLALAGDGNYFASMINDNAPFSPGKPYYQSLKIAHILFSSGFSEADFVLNNWEQSKRDFIASKNALFFLGNWAIPQLIESGMRSDDIGFIPFPFDNSGKSKAILNFDWGMAVSRYSKNPDTAKAWIAFMITKSNFADVAGFIPTDKSRKSNMPQLAEYMAYQPEIIQVAPESNDFIRLTNKAGMDFMSGNYIRNILLSPDFDGSMAYWNKRWGQAKENF
ncbi:MULTISPECIES: ABC transporter substrate-binding protein [unclassified Cellvibrio]|uniref:ABC transporter substrate-binding protein n=1 Tax=unclassified Cellvibrio TaxID=2624793 RepID=UPI0007810C40|nr:MULTISPECIES: ABC transporter substrate-binding protein [unclassified Cellvibrio]QEY17017.1 carbohydrate ABC transporter substrate-binding protein [Cellvibrio sp. KY-GH-1]